MHYAALGAGQADVSQTRWSALRTRVEDVLTLLVKSRGAISNARRVRVPTGMYATSLAFERSLPDCFSPCF